MTIFGKDGRESFSMVNEVVELSPATLDAALFEAPADYREVKDFSAGSLAAAADGAEPDSQQPSDSGVGANVGDLAGQQSRGASAELGAKKPGVVRLGLAGVTTGAVGDGLSAPDLAAAVQSTLSERLKGPAVEVVRLEAQNPTQVEAEARQKECDFVVYANVSHKKGGGGGFGGMLGKVVAPAVGIGQADSTSGGGGPATANFKQKDELTLDVKLVAAGTSAPAAARQFKSKARSAGEDIITPVVEQAARMVLDASAGH